MHSSQPLTTRSPDDIIAHGAAGAVRISQLLGDAAALAAELPSRPYVINLAADRCSFLLGFCAAIIAGQVTLMPPNRQPRTLRQLAHGHAGCYTFGETAIDGIEHFDSATVASASQQIDTPAPVVPPDQLCAIVFTSGSTGTPTPNRKYWRTLCGGSFSNAALLCGKHEQRVNLLATVPPQHMWGLETSILLPLFTNIAFSCRTPFFPQDIADALAALPAPRVLVSSPVHLDAFLRASTGRIEIAEILSATAPLSARLAQGLEDYFSADVIEVFGSSETGIIARRNTATESLWQLAPCFDLDATEKGSRVRAEHLPEEIALQDIVELVDGGRFRWLGRAQDMINIAGKRGSLADLNHRLQAIPGVVDGVIFLPDENSPRLAALVVAPDLEAAEILAQLRPDIEPAFLPRPLYRVPELPRQETGKLARNKLVELYAKIRKAEL